jgi:hypothetical protein
MKGAADRGVLVVDTAMKLLMVSACPTTGAQVALLLRGGLEAYRKFNPVRVTLQCRQCGGFHALPTRDGVLAEWDGEVAYKKVDVA